MLLSSVAFALACSAVQSSKGFVLVDKGEAKARIVLPPDAVPSDRRAAEILQASVKAMSGAVLPIQFDPSPSPAGTIEIGFGSTALAVDGFAIRASNSTVGIVSGGRKGSIYGVVDLLERFFGCRCYSPKVQVFPKRSTLIIEPVSYVSNPVNSFRAINGDFAADPNWLDWQRLNTTSEMFGNGFYVHTFQRLVPPDDYLKPHPEYFALIGGRRVAQQLCPSRSENVDIAVESLKKAMTKDPDKPAWSVSQNDNPDYCHCPECLKIIEEEGSPAGPILRFVNAVAKHFPNKTISTLAYEYSRTAPRVTKPDPNVQIMLCTIELTRSRPISIDPTCAGFRNDIVNWGKICHNIYLWDYTVDFAHQISPFPNIPVLQPNIQFFVKNNANQHFQQSNTSPGHEFSELKSYLLARLLWNPNADARGIVKGFLKGYYGAAAPQIERYISDLERNLQRSGTRLDIFERPVAHKNDFLSAAAMAKYNELFDRAEAATAKDPETLARVQVARLPIQYATLAIAADDVFGPRGFFEDVAGRPTLRQDLERTLDRFAETCAANGVRSVNESNLTPSQFCNAIRGMLHLEIDGNLAFRKTVMASPPPSQKYGHGDIAHLTNGIKGSSDFGVQWLGWEGTSFDLTLDLGSNTSAHQASIASLYAQRSWILHPKSIACAVSADGKTFTSVGLESVPGDQKAEELIKTYRFQWSQANVRFVRFHVEGTNQLPPWHPGAGGKSWVFLDEITVR
jgi:hypothetical protein